MKTKLAFFMSVIMIFSCLYTVNIHAENSIEIIESNGWFETAYVKWLPHSNADSYNVYSKKTDGSYIKLDDELIREYDGYFRADALGLTSGEYTLKIVPVDNGAEIEDSATESDIVTVKAYTREGFAFSPNSPYGSANGCYNPDGTLRSDADVIYITDSNKDTVTINGDPSLGVGITNILSVRDKQKSEKPLAIRFIGKVTMPADVTNYMLKTSTTKNVTIEGVGDDATLHGWGLTFKRACNIEVRNIGIMWYGGLGSDGDALSLDTDNKNVWLHNNDFFYGAPGADEDQVKGDGSIDLKTRSDYVTISYNHFWDSGKSSVSGGVWETNNIDNPEAKIFVTYHHNWFDHSDSRHPRCVVGSTHVYNNYYDGVSKYGVAASMYASVFVEGNYFRNCPRPMLIATQGSDCYDSSSGTYTDKGTLSGQDGGMIKEYNNHIEGAKRFYTYQNTPDKGEFDAYHVDTRSELIPETVTAKKGGATYNNFDTNKSIMYEYTYDSPENARDKVIAYAGRLNGGDFKWFFDNNTEDENHDIIPELQQAIMNYTSSLVSVPAISENSNSTESPMPDQSEQPATTSAPSATTAPAGSSIVHNFTEQGLESSFFAFGEGCNLKSDKDTVIYDSKALTRCLELGSTTSFSFTAPADGKCTLVYSTIKAVDAKINGVKTYGDTTTGLLTFDLKKGEYYEITKNNSAYLFYINIQFNSIIPPVPTNSPNPTSSPAATGSPVPTSFPAATNSPEHTSSPAATSSPEPTSSPETTTAPDEYIYKIVKSGFDENGNLDVEINYTGNANSEAVLIAAKFSSLGVLRSMSCFNISENEIKDLDFIKPDDGYVMLFIWDSIDSCHPLSKSEMVQINS